MSLSKNLHAAVAGAILLTGVAASPVSAQTTCKNQYPCGECAVFDNNGNDLRGFINSNRKQMAARAGKVSEYSADSWGYLLVRTARVPSVSSKWETKGDLNHTASINTTLVMTKTKDGDKATWWARECSLPAGPLVQIKIRNEEKVLDIEDMRYEKFTHDLDPKKMTLVEYADTANDRDYDYLLKNYILTKSNTIANPDDYKAIIDFYNGFLSKFSEVDDALLSNSSFITFVKGAGDARYIGYFNMVNSKLSGKLELADIQYERDRDTVVKHVFRKLNGNIVYIYGDDTYGLDKTIIQYGKAHNLKLRRRKTDITTKFNDEKL